MILLPEGEPARNGIKMISKALVVASLIALGAGRAAARDEPPELKKRLGFDLGIGSAVGVMGLVYHFVPTHHWRLEGGLGWGLSGIQLSFMPKLALGGTCAFIMGLGPSLGVGGPYADKGPVHQPQPGVVGWLNADVPGFECRSEAGFSFDFTLGLTMALTTFHYDIAGVGGTIHQGDILPQARLGLGWWF
jgi:hypothetical protein